MQRPSGTTPSTTAAIEAGRLAPSAHNSQPARFGATGDAIAVRWDRRRELPAGDPHRFYLFAGLGATTESLVLGAAGHGQRAEVTAADRPDDTHAAVVTLSAGTPEPDDVELAGSVSARRTTRLPFRPDAVPVADIGRLRAEAQKLGCELLAVDGARAMDGFADLVARGTARNFGDADVYREFFSWLRLRPGHPDHDRDGLSATALSLGRLQTLAAPIGMTPAAMRLLGHARLHGLLAGTQRRLARHAPAACLVVPPSGGLGDRFTGGRAMLRVWARATTLGLRVHPMTAPMDHDETRRGLADLFGVAPGSPMVVCFRVGYGAGGPRSPRIPIDELLH